MFYFLWHEIGCCLRLCVLDRDIHSFLFGRSCGGLDLDYPELLAILFGIFFLEDV